MNAEVLIGEVEMEKQGSMQVPTRGPPERVLRPQRRAARGLPPDPPSFGGHVQPALERCVLDFSTFQSHHDSYISASKF